MPKNSNPEESDQKNEGVSSNENPKNDDIKSSNKEALSLFEEQEKREKELEWQRMNRLKENDIRLNDHFNSTNQKVLEFLK